MDAKKDAQVTEQASYTLQGQATVTEDEDVIVMVSVPESIIKQLEEPDNAALADGEEKDKKKKSLWNKMGAAYSNFGKYKTGGNHRIVRMPQSEYKKYWVRDGDTNKYKGTEPEDSPEKLKLLKLRLEDEELQAVGKKDVEAEIKDWKPLKERSGWSRSAVEIQGGGFVG